MAESHTTALSGQKSHFSFAARVALPAALCLSWSAAAGAELITVMPSDDYSKIEAAVAGDVVEIQPGTYSFRVFLDQQGTASEPIVVRAADPNNRPVWDLAGGNVETFAGSYTGGDNGRGCWQVGGSHYQISGIVFRNCHTSSGNAPGLRARDAQDLVVRDVLVEDSDVGFSGDGENVTLEFSELRNNGRVSTPPQHSIYIFGGSFNLRYSYVHDSIGGQNLHIRARESVIEYNWIARAANYEADIMEGGDAQQSMVFRGNVLVGNESPANGSTVFTLYNSQGGGGVSMDLSLVYNTIVLRSGQNPALVSIRNDTLDGATLDVSNNIIQGTNRAFNIAAPGTSNTTLGGSNNWFEAGADVGPLSATVFGTEPGFVDGTSLDFALASASDAVGAASPGAGTPDREYFEDQDNPMMFRWRSSASDLGAFESTTTGPGYGPYDDPGQPPGGGGPGGGAAAGGSGGTGATGGTGGIGGAGASLPGGAATDDDGGCGCVLPGTRVGTTSGRTAWLAGIALLLSLLRTGRTRRKAAWR